MTPPFGGLLTKQLRCQQAAKEAFRSSALYRPNELVEGCARHESGGWSHLLDLNPHFDLPVALANVFRQRPLTREVECREVRRESVGPAGDKRSRRVVEQA